MDKSGCCTQMYVVCLCLKQSHPTRQEKDPQLEPVLTAAACLLLTSLYGEEALLSTERSESKIQRPSRVFLCSDSKRQEGSESTDRRTEQCKKIFQGLFLPVGEAPGTQSPPILDKT